MDQVSVKLNWPWGLPQKISIHLNDQLVWNNCNKEIIINANFDFVIPQGILNDQMKVEVFDEKDCNINESKFITISAVDFIIQTQNKIVCGENKQYKSATLIYPPF